MRPALYSKDIADTIICFYSITDILVLIYSIWRSISNMTCHRYVWGHSETGSHYINTVNAVNCTTHDIVWFKIVKGPSSKGFADISFFFSYSQISLLVFKDIFWQFLYKSNSIANNNLVISPNCNKQAIFETQKHFKDCMSFAENSALMWLISTTWVGLIICGNLFITETKRQDLKQINMWF